MVNSPDLFGQMARCWKLRRAGFWRWPYDVRKDCSRVQSSGQKARLASKSSAWFQSALRGTASSLAALKFRRCSPSPSRSSPEHGAVLLGMAAILLVVPAAANLRRVMPAQAQNRPRVAGSRSTHTLAELQHAIAPNSRSPAGKRRSIVTRRTLNRA